MSGTKGNGKGRLEDEPFTILLVEDDDIDAKALRRALSKAGMEHYLVHASDGSEARDMLNGANGHRKITGRVVILIDINMPKLNGIELIRYIREHASLHDSIIFVLTTSNSKSDRVAAYDLNIAGYIVKAELSSSFESLTGLIDCYRRYVELPPA